MRRLKRFAIIGALGTVVYGLSTWLLFRLCGFGIIQASGIAFAIVVFFNYVLHYRWTFKSQKIHTIAFPQFVMTSVVGFLINWSVLEIGVVRIGLDYLFVQLFAIGLVITSNFLLSALWVFRS